MQLLKSVLENCPLFNNIEIIISLTSEQSKLVRGIFNSIIKIIFVSTWSHVVSSS